MNQQSILIVDDSASFCTLIRNYLKNKSHTVFCAKGASDAWEFLQTHSVHLLLLDWEMPEITGIEFLNRLRSDWRYINLPVIMMTGSPTLKRAKEAMRSGCDDFVSKLEGPEYLYLRVQHLMEQKGEVPVLEEGSENQILLVDDNPIFLKVAQQFLKRRNLNVCTEQSASQALKLLKQQEFSVIIVDWMMPEIDGLEFVRTVRQMPTPYNNIPLIILSARGEVSDVVAALDAGADDFLQKTSTSLLEKKIKSLLRIQRRYQKQSQRIIEGKGRVEVLVEERTHELRQQKEYVDNILASMMDILLVIDANSKIKRVNPAAASLLEYKEEELLGMPVEHLFGLQTTETKINLVEALQTIKIDSICKTDLSFLCLDANGQILRASPSVLKILGSPSEKYTQRINTLTFPPLIEAGISEDIRHCMESNTRVIAERYYVTQYGKKLNIHFRIYPLKQVGSSAKHYYILSYDKLSFPHPNLESWEEHLGLGTSNAHKNTLFWNLDNEIYTQSGKLLPILSSCSLLKNEAGEIQGAVLLAKNIKQRRNAENALKKHQEELEELVKERTKQLTESEHKYRTLVQNTQDVFYRTDTEGRITFISDSISDHLGYGQDEFIGKFVKDFYVNPDDRNSLFQLLEEQGRVSNFEHMLRCKDGGVFWGSSNSHFYKDEEGNILGVEGITRDITQQKKSEAALQLAKEEAEAANHAKTRFLANMSHEIRTPLNAISGFSQVLMNLCSKNNFPKEIQEFLGYIHVSSQNLSELINNILDLSKIEAGKMQVHEESLNPQLLLQGVFHINKASAQKKRLDYRYASSANIPRLIRSDRAKLNQILMNLVANAVKFTPEEGKVSIQMSCEKPWIIFDVEDSGVGISEKQLAHIFDAFEQADSSTSRKFGGTGLGLSICRQMVQLLDGSIEVKSELGKGSLFRLKLPLIEHATQELVESSQMQASSFAEGNVILLVEDNLLNQKMMTAVFQSLDLKVHCAHSGSIGIEKAIELQPDLILMDMHMPEMDGEETTRRILQHPQCKNIPIVALSADAFKTQRDRAFSIGIQDYLTKPLNLKELDPILKKYLRTVDVAESDSASKGLQPLPEQESLEVHSLFVKLESTPLFQSKKIVDTARTIQVLCEGWDTPYLACACHIEDSVYSKNTIKVKTLIEEALKIKQ